MSVQGANFRHSFRTCRSSPAARTTMNGRLEKEASNRSQSRRGPAATMSNPRSRCVTLAVGIRASLPVLKHNRHEKYKGKNASVSVLRVLVLQEFVLWPRNCSYRCRMRTKCALPEPPKGLYVVVKATPNVTTGLDCREQSAGASDSNTSDALRMMNNSVPQGKVFRISDSWAA
jgi:hypothetical protein